MTAPTEISFETTIEVGGACLCLHVQQAARATARRFDEAFRPLGLTNGQFSLMMALNNPVPPSMKAIAARLAMDRTTLTAALKPLERRGLVTVTIDKTDRRSRVTTLTPAGRRKLAAALPVWRLMHAAIERLVASADRLRADLLALS